MKPNLLPLLLLGAFGSFQIQTDHRSNTSNKHQERKIVKKNAVKIFPNPSYDGNITVSSNTLDKLHFYIFDLEGTLIHQAIFKNRQKKTVSNLKKGIYMYDVFKDDVSVDHGKIIIK